VSALDVLRGASGRALALDPDTSFDDWCATGAVLGELHKASPWWIGDWLNFGEFAFGERYAQGAEALGLHPQTLMNYAHTARRVPPHNRVEGLSFRAHSAVASLPPAKQRPLLAIAKEQELASGDVRRVARMVSEGQELPRAVDEVERERASVEPPDLESAARSVWLASRRNGEGYLVPVEPMRALADALGLGVE
jgi:hypothetical protein